MIRNSASMVFTFVAIALCFVPTSAVSGDSESGQSESKDDAGMGESRLKTPNAAPKSQIANPKPGSLSLRFPSVFKKSFLYKEFNFLTVYSDETGEFDYTPRLPRTSIGLEYFC